MKTKLTAIETKFLQLVRNCDLTNGYMLSLLLHKTERQLRRIKKSLISKGILIGATPERGYFEIKTRQDLKDATKNYAKYIGAYASMVKLFNRKVIGQKKIRFAK